MNSISEILEEEESLIDEEPLSMSQLNILARTDEEEAAYLYFEQKLRESLHRDYYQNY